MELRYFISAPLRLDSRLFIVENVSRHAYLLVLRLSHHPGDLPATCPKCGKDLIRAKARKSLVIDLAHRGETVSQALAELDQAVSECVLHDHSSLPVD